MKSLIPVLALAAQGASGPPEPSALAGTARFRHLAAQRVTLAVTQCLNPADNKASHNHSGSQEEPKRSESLLSSADSVLREMSRITGLPVRAQLKKKIVNRAEIRSYLTERLHAEYTPQEIHRQEAVLKAFGLVSRQFNLSEFLVRFYTEQAAGVYDQHSKTMLIASWVEPQMQQMVLAHELTHALQDQNFDLEKFLYSSRENDDSTGARQAVVEGYATAAMMQKFVEPLELSDLPALGPMMEQVIRMQTEEFPAFSSAPFFFKFQALFPYTEGMSFMQQALKQGGWHELNNLFTQPPRTTREIFHPQAYFNHATVSPVGIRLPTPLARVPGLHLADDSTMGELGYYVLLGQFITESEAKAIAPGWRGDRYMVYEDLHTGNYGLLAITRWSSPEISLAFFRDYHTILGRKYTELSTDVRSEPEMFIGSTTSGKIALLRRGNECVWAEGVPDSQLAVIKTYLESCLKPEPGGTDSAWNESKGTDIGGKDVGHVEYENPRSAGVYPPRLGR